MYQIHHHNPYVIELMCLGLVCWKDHLLVLCVACYMMMMFPFVNIKYEYKCQAIP